MHYFLLSVERVRFTHSQMIRSKNCLYDVEIKKICLYWISYITIQGDIAGQFYFYVERLYNYYQQKQFQCFKFQFHLDV